MRRFLSTFAMVVAGLVSQAQEFNCQVSVIAPQIATAQPRVFQSLELAIKEFYQSRRFTNLNFAPSERIDINMRRTSGCLMIGTFGPPLTPSSAP